MTSPPSPLACCAAPSAGEGSPEAARALLLNGIGLWHYIVAGDELYWDALTRQIYGVSDEFVPTVEDALGIFRSDARSTIEQAFGACLTKGQSFSVILPLCRADGSLVWVRTVGEPMHCDGSICGARGTMQDVSPLKVAQDRAERGEQRLLDAIEALPDGFVLYDPSERLVIANKRYREINARVPESLTPGTRYEDMVRMAIREGLYPEALGREEAFLANRLDQFRNPSEDPVELELADGRWLHMIDRRTSTGEHVGYRGDITILKRQQQELKRAKEAAEAAQAQAEAASIAKTQFLANTSHEVRTPLSGVLGMLDLLAGEDMPPAQQEKIDLARGAARSLLNILNDILDLSKLEAGEITFETISFDLHDLLLTVCTLFGQKAEAKGLHLACTIDDDLPGHISGDPTRLRQVLGNLVGNAIKFTDSGSVSVEARRCTNGTCVHFQVRDTGIGIPPEAMPRLFTRFSQADPSMTRRFGGTGLGLAICRELVTGMGGDIGADSDPDTGSRFWFTLPLTPGHAIAAASNKTSLPALAPLHILVAEDNSLNQMIIRGLMERHGHRLDFVDDGAKAVAAVETGSFDLVLMDIQMPVMDGLEATRAIRHLPEGKDLPIIALTANAMQGDREIYLAAGMDDHVTKPIDLPALLDAIARQVPQAVAPA